MGLRNLLEETEHVLQKYNYTPKDIYYITDGVYWCTWDDFAERADSFWYDSGFGWVEVNETLKMVGVDFWFERNEYDGSEWWTYHSLPVRPEHRGYVRLGSRDSGDDEDENCSD